MTSHRTGEARQAALAVELRQTRAQPPEPPDRGAAGRHGQHEEQDQNRTQQATEHNQKASGPGPSDLRQASHLEPLSPGA